MNSFVSWLRDTAVPVIIPISTLIGGLVAWIMRKNDRKFDDIKTEVKELTRNVMGLGNSVGELNSKVSYIESYLANKK